MNSVNLMLAVQVLNVSQFGIDLATYADVCSTTNQAHEGRDCRVKGRNRPCGNCNRRDKEPVNGGHGSSQLQNPSYSGKLSVFCFLVFLLIVTFYILLFYLIQGDV